MAFRLLLSEQMDPWERWEQMASRLLLLRHVLLSRHVLQVGHAGTTRMACQSFQATSGPIPEGAGPGCLPFRVLRPFLQADGGGRRAERPRRGERRPAGDGYHWSLVHTAPLLASVVPQVQRPGPARSPTARFSK